jgi:hypothetical protein
MQPISELEPYLQKQVDAGSSGLDILHGHLKVLLLEAEERLNDALLGEGYEYLTGQLDALSHIYSLTYQLSFAIGDRNNV